MDATEFWLSVALVLYSLVAAVWTFAQWRRSRAPGLLLVDRLLMLAFLAWLFGQPLAESWLGWPRSPARLLLVGVPLFVGWIAITIRRHRTL